MNRSEIHYFESEKAFDSSKATAVCLHGHTYHSKESYAFIERLYNNIGIVKLVIGHFHRRGANPALSGDPHALRKELARMWWTSPVSPRFALDIERGQIEERLGLRPIVSLSDHDNIEAPLRLQVMEPNETTPISVEWTVPFRETYFHIGMHNLPLDTATAWYDRLAEYTAEPDEAELAGLFEDFRGCAGSLVVFNHPIWDQPWLGSKAHEELIEQFLTKFGRHMDALEINGLRSIAENRRCVELSRATGIPLISGGDRHGQEPAAVLNITNASSFAEFADDIRGGAQSEILVMPQFFLPLTLRVVENMAFMVSDQPGESLGRIRWSDRMYRRCRDEHSRSFHEIFGDKEPTLARAFIWCVQQFSNPKVRSAVLAMQRDPEVSL